MGIFETLKNFSKFNGQIYGYDYENIALQDVINSAVRSNTNQIVNFPSTHTISYKTPQFRL